MWESWERGQKCWLEEATFFMLLESVNNRNSPCSAGAQRAKAPSARTAMLEMELITHVGVVAHKPSPRTNTIPFSDNLLHLSLLRPLVTHSLTLCHS